MIKLSKILSVLITLVFLVPTTGFYFVKHSCLHSGSEKIILSDSFECCGSGNKDQKCCPTAGKIGHDKTNFSNCFRNTMKSHENCCINEIIYLKDDSQYSGPTKDIIKVPVFEVPFSPYHSESSYIKVISRILPFKSPGFSSGGILSMTSQLLL